MEIFIKRSDTFTGILPGSSQMKANYSVVVVFVVLTQGKTDHVQICGGFPGKPQVSTLSIVNTDHGTTLGRLGDVS